MSYIAEKIINGVYQDTFWKPNANTKAYYKLNENILDYSGNNLHLTDLSWSGTTSPPDSIGKFGNSKAFNGTSDLIYINQVPSIDLSHFTVSLWAYLETGSQNSCLIQVGDADGFMIILQTSTINWLFQGIGWQPSIHSPSLNTWHNIICTRGDGTNTVYLDGVSSVVGTSAPDPLDGPLMAVGGTVVTGDPMTYPSFLVGKLNEIIIEDVCWSQTDVTNYYNKYK